MGASNMPQPRRVLRNLKIAEVSTVDKGAGEGTRVVLRKRDDPAAVYRKIFGAETLRDMLDRAAASPSLPRFKQDDSEDEDRLREEEDAAAREEEQEEADEEEDARRAALDDGGGDGNSFGKDHNASRVADLLVEASQGRLSKPAALWWLIHHRAGAATLRRLTQKREVIPMPREQELSAIAKRFGIEAIAKKLVTEGAGGISEFEITKLIQEAASRAYPELKPAVGFTKIYEDSVLLRQAVAVCKTFHVTAGAPRAAAGGTVSGSALDELLSKAAELKKREPGLTPAQAFARVYSAPENVEIAKRERAENRPVAG
jgi:hypothetical protein